MVFRMALGKVLRDYANDNKLIKERSRLTLMTSENFWQQSFCQNAFK